LITNETEEFNKDLNFSLEGILLFNYDTAYYNSSGVQPQFRYGTDNFPEFLNSDELVFEVFNPKQISEIDLQSFKNNLFKINPSDYFIKYLSPLNFNSSSGGVFRGNNFLFQIISPSKKGYDSYDERYEKQNNFGNQLFFLRLTLPDKTVEVPLIRINGEYKLIIDMFFLDEIFNIDITQTMEIPMNTIYNGQSLKQTFGLSSIRSYITKNPNYFEKYKVRNDIFKIKRLNSLNDKRIKESSIPKESVFFIFDLE
jgi:hypothetical protein